MGGFPPRKRGPWIRVSHLADAFRNYRALRPHGGLGFKLLRNASPALPPKKGHKLGSHPAADPCSGPVAAGAEGWI